MSLGGESLALEQITEIISDLKTFTFIWFHHKMKLRERVAATHSDELILRSLKTVTVLAMEATGSNLLGAAVALFIVTFYGTFLH